MQALGTSLHWAKQRRATVRWDERRREASQINLIDEGAVNAAQILEQVSACLRNDFAVFPRHHFVLQDADVVLPRSPDSGRLSFRNLRK